MIYIVHGENYSKSRLQIQGQFKKSESETRVDLELVDTTPDKLLDAVTSKSLFGGNTFVVFDITGSGRTNLDAYVETAARTLKENTLVVLSAKELTKANAFMKSAATLGAHVTLNPEIPQSSIFKFLDAVFSKNRLATYTELKKLNDDATDNIYLISMTAWGLRNLAAAKFNSPKFEKLPPFIKSKAQKQSQNFTEDNVKGFYELVYKSDLETKTGRIAPEAAVISIVEKVLNS